MNIHQEGKIKYMMLDDQPIGIAQDEGVVFAGSGNAMKGWCTDTRGDAFDTLPLDNRHVAYAGLRNSLDADIPVVGKDSRGIAILSLKMPWKDGKYSIGVASDGKSAVSFWSVQCGGQYDICTSWLAGEELDPYDRRMSTIMEAIDDELGIFNHKDG